MIDFKDHYGNLWELMGAYAIWEEEKSISLDDVAYAEKQQQPIREELLSRGLTQEDIDRILASGNYAKPPQCR
jgi:hypothetical protein